MRIIIKILIFTFITQAFGQNKIEAIEFSIITNSCKNNSEWNKKKECSKTEIIKKIREEFNYDIIEKFSNNDLRIWYLFTFDSKGNLTNTQIKTNNKTLKSEFERIWKNIDIQVHLEDENGNPINGKFRLPINIQTR